MGAELRVRSPTDRQAAVSLVRRLLHRWSAAPSARGKASARVGGGRYLVDGMKFSMGGYWVVDVAIDSSNGADVVSFELRLWERQEAAVSGGGRGQVLQDALKRLGATAARSSGGGWRHRREE
jgi:hypothetical protein